jgi:hypothetical protein
MHERLLGIWEGERYRSQVFYPPCHGPHMVWDQISQSIRMKCVSKFKYDFYVVLTVKLDSSSRVQFNEYDKG